MEAVGASRGTVLGNDTSVTVGTTDTFDLDGSRECRGVYDRKEARRHG
jgi:hypothetical protein